MDDAPQILFDPGDTADIVQGAIARLERDRIVQRIWSLDHTVWSPYPDEILNRLGWLSLPETMRPQLDEIEMVTESLRADGIRQVVVLGMGGASLVAEVFQAAFDDAASGMTVTVLDSTHPEAIQRLLTALNLAETAFIFSMKKWALETYSLFKYFYTVLEDALGAGAAVKRFIAITDAGAWVAPYAGKMGFRHIFYNDPYVGGRYAALSHVGLLPAALSGVDLHELLARAESALECCRRQIIAPDENAGAWLGAIIGGLAGAGRDKLTFIASASLESWLAWVEQLIAESTGKGGTGILPVIEPPAADPNEYGQDRLFVVLEDARRDDLTQQREALVASGHPVIHIRLRDAYDLGAQFACWEFAAAVAGHILGIQPFDQPDVESAKAAAGRVLDDYQRLGHLPELTPILHENGLAAFGDERGKSLRDVLGAFLALVQPRDYLAVQAYLPPDAPTTQQLRRLQAALRRATGCAVTVGYGPRFLHSTGQLHKGDGGRGHFIQITSRASVDLPVPRDAGSTESDYSFGTLLTAQALGDWRALQQRGRHVLRLHVEGTVQPGMEHLLAIIC